MNKIFKVIWSKARSAWVVVSEIARNHGSKDGGVHDRRNRYVWLTRAITLSLVLGSTAVVPAYAAAGPPMRLPGRKSSMVVLLSEIILTPRVIYSFMGPVNFMELFYSMMENLLTTARIMASVSAKPNITVNCTIIPSPLAILEKAVITASLWGAMLLEKVRTT